MAINGGTGPSLSTLAQTIPAKPKGKSHAGGGKTKSDKTQTPSKELSPEALVQAFFGIIQLAQALHTQPPSTNLAMSGTGNPLLNQLGFNSIG